MMHRDELYNSYSDPEAEVGETIRRLQQMAKLIKQSGYRSQRTGAGHGRNLLTRTVDVAIAGVRQYIPPIHWLWAVIVAAVFIIYAYLLVLTIRLTVVGERRWPDVPVPCVLVMWHGCVNSWIVAMAARRPRIPLAIMIARDPRGDCLSLFCRLLGMRVVRGESGEQGWEALTQLALEITHGACAVMTADGTGPALVAKVGAVALASATGATLVPVGAGCRPGISARHKWDQARTPLPFGRLVVTLGPSRRLPVYADLGSIEKARCWLQTSLNEAISAARRPLS
jgi:lysophospholipid acyltransferase (LPLAT)-like uncharacterized protein